MGMLTIVQNLVLVSKTAQFKSHAAGLIRSPAIYMVQKFEGIACAIFDKSIKFGPVIVLDIPTNIRYRPTSISQGNDDLRGC